MFRRIINYDPGAPGGAEGGGGTPPAGGSPTPDPVVTAETTELETLSTKDEATLTDVEKTRLTELKGKYETVLMGEDGKPLSPAQVAEYKEREGKVNAILAKPEDKRTPEEVKYLADNTLPDEDQKTVYQQVDELRGAPIEVEYGDVDPASPQGILLREETIAFNSKRELETQIQKDFPRAYQYMLHLKNGGKEADFFAPQNQDFLSVKLDKDDKVTQERILRTALELKGNSPDIIEIAVTSIKDKAALLETAQRELEALQETQKKNAAKVQQELAVKKEKAEKDVDTFLGALQTSVEKGFDGIVIPLTEREKFTKFVADRVDYNHNEGAFYLSKKIDAAGLAKELKVAYFEFKGGDLKGLVERTSKTQNAIKIKGAGKTVIVPKGSVATEKKYIPAGQL